MRHTYTPETGFAYMPCPLARSPSPLLTLGLPKGWQADPFLQAGDQEDSRENLASR